MQICGPGIQRGNIKGAAAIAATRTGGSFLVLEQSNMRIQALDSFGQPLNNYFSNSKDALPYVPLKAESGTVEYLDISVEPVGFIYVLSGATIAGGAKEYRLDVYKPDGSWLCQTKGVAAMRMLADRWRNVYTINYEMLLPPDGRTEPSVSEWNPNTPP
jgi:hypothetical protein